MLVTQRLQVVILLYMSMSLRVSLSADSSVNLVCACDTTIAGHNCRLASDPECQFLSPSNAHVTQQLQVVILLYLVEETSSMLVIAPAAVGVILQVCD